MSDPVRWRPRSKVRTVLLWVGALMMLGCVPVAMVLACLWLYRNGWDLTWPVLWMVFVTGLILQQIGIDRE